MGKLNIFGVVFDNPTGVFYSGQAVQGHVIVELNEPMKMRGIHLNFDGKAYVHWTESETETYRDSNGQSQTRTITRHYSSSEKYFDQDILLYGIWSGQGSNTFELPQGRHTFPFQFQLPQGLPSSFEHNIGHVRYKVKCKIDKPWKFDHNTRRPFTVIGILDLNQQPLSLAMQNSERDKFLCCLCCKSGPIHASFHIERTGYVPGEAIKIYADISNASSRGISKSYVELKMITKFHATSKTKTVTKTVARIQRPSIDPHDEDRWTGEGLVIPPLPPSYLVGCRIIDINYILQLNVDPSGPAFDLEIPYEVIIGTIPLAQIVESFPPMPPVGLPLSPLAPSAPSGAELLVYPSGPPTGLPNLPPPSYSDCVTGPGDMREEGDNEHTKGDQFWSPQYTYYNWGHTPGAMPEQWGKQK